MKIEQEFLREHAELFEPSKAELAALRLHESGVRFEILPPIGISEGRQSRVSILEYRITDESRRVLWKRMGAGRGFTKDEAQLFQSRLLPYRHVLRTAGWNVPESFHTAVVAIEDEHQIFSYERLVGRGDGDNMLMNPEEPNFRKWHLLRSTIQTLARYPRTSLTQEEVAGQKVSRLPHGLDLKTANVVLDESGTLWFVDLFGTKEINKDGSWQTYSTKLDSLKPENLIAVCATREGMILRMYRLVEKAWTSAGGIEQEVLRSDFIVLLESLEMPSGEVSFITDQIHTDFPWLNSIYSERQV